MPLNIPFGNTADSVLRVNLEGQAYDIRYRWNNLSECWYMYLGFSGEEPIFKTKLLAGFNLLAPYRAIRGVPKGALYVIDTLKEYGRPGRDNIGIDERFKIVYISTRELGIS